MAKYVIHLKFDGGSIVVSPKVSAVIQPDRLGDRITTLLKLRFDVHDGVVRGALTVRSARLEESVVDIRDVVPFVAVKRHAEYDFSRCHAGFEIPFDSGAGIVVRLGIF